MIFKIFSNELLQSIMNLFVRKKKFTYAKQILKNLLDQNSDKRQNYAALQKVQSIIPFIGQEIFQTDNARRLLCSDSTKDTEYCDKQMVDIKADSAGSKKPPLKEPPAPKKESSAPPKEPACGPTKPPSKKSSGGKGSGENGRHSFHPDTEAVLNEQASAEFDAAFAYLSMAVYFGRTEVALPGCQGFFMNMYEEELGHGNIFVNYVLMRGGHVKLKDVKYPKDDAYTIPTAYKTALKMEMHIKEKLCNVFDVAEKHKDLQVMDLVSTEFMEEQNRSICEMARLCTRAKMVDTSVGEHLYDQMIFKSFVKTEKDNLMNKRNLEFGEHKHGIYK